MTQERDVNARRCSNCGGALEEAAAGRPTVCHYCGQKFSAPIEASPPQRVIIIAPGARPMGSPPRRRARGSIFGTIFSFLIVGVVSLVSLRRAAPTVVAKMPSEIVSALDSAEESTITWDGAGGPPIPAAVGGSSDGFVGRVQMGIPEAVWIAAFDAKLAQVWRAGPFGTIAEGVGSTLFAVVGGDVIVSDYRSNLHVYDAASGKEKRTLKLSDRAKRICPLNEGKPRVWIEMNDEKNLLVDPLAGSSTPAPRPASCADPWGKAWADCRGWRKEGAPREGCKPPEAAPNVAGFAAENVIEEGDLAVAYGHRHPGTATPMAVGFDPKTKSVRWQEPLASGDPSAVAEWSPTTVMDALAGGRFVAPYELTSKGSHLTALDARTGQRLWDSALAPRRFGTESTDGLSMSATRLYLVRGSSLDVYDPKTGAFLGKIGQ